MNKIVLETGLSDHHKIRVKFHEHTILETGFADYHQIRINLS